MKWYIGQRIVAIKSHSPYYKIGDEFTIKGLRSPFCKCGYIMVNVGIPNIIGHITTTCGACHKTEPTENILFFPETNFSPLDEMEQAISELMEETMPV